MFNKNRGVDFGIYQEVVSKSDRQSSTIVDQENEAMDDDDQDEELVFEKQPQSENIYNQQVAGPEPVAQDGRISSSRLVSVIP